jgi:apolipoprotein N-acyltransferase
MMAKTEYPPRLVTAVIVLGAFLATALVAFAPGLSPVTIGMSTVLYLVYLFLHPAWALALLLGGPRRPAEEAAQRRAGEVLFFFGTFLFLFAYIFASNANMDYVQRFIEGGGEIQLAPDTRTERLIAAGRYLPLLAVDLILWISAARRLGREEAWSGVGAPALTVLAVALSVLSFPSFVDLDGYAILGWIALVPLFIVIRVNVDRGAPGRAVGYGVIYGVLLTLLGNSWLGTFNLISLQAVGIIFFGFYGIYMVVAVVLLRSAPPGPMRGLILPLSWTAFELARSSGFLGYPWLLVAHSQYANVPLIQWAELGGVWLVSLIVLLVNGTVAEAVMAVAARVGAGGPARVGVGGPARVGVGGPARTGRAGDGPEVAGVPGAAGAPGARWAVAAAAIILVTHAGGALFLLRPLPTRDTVRIALIQQNSDPRKHEYDRTFDSLVRLTDETLSYEPDLIAWSETAFVPNIRRWSAEDPQRYRLARLVGDFLAYQESLDRWLLTGNDDYRRVFDEEGREIRRDSYNAAVLFSDEAERRETYHKIRLVPFTEHFPYERQLPWVYQMLLDFDIAFWTPGEERTVFEHPKMRFSTPICFEDVFPGEVRQFARNGMEVIVNITNDYWSLRETAAKQHFVAALFRTVELRRPMVRSTASGVTSHIDARGRIVATVPQYSEQYLIADVAVPDLTADGGGRTLYIQWGDWVPFATGAAAMAIALAGAIGSGRTRRVRTAGTSLTKERERHD